MRIADRNHSTWRICSDQKKICPAKDCTVAHLNADFVDGILARSNKTAIQDSGRRINVRHHTISKSTQGVQRVVENLIFLDMIVIYDE